MLGRFGHIDLGMSDLCALEAAAKSATGMLCNSSRPMISIHECTAPDASTLHDVAPVPQERSDPLDMLALNLKPIFLDRSTRAAP
jgi:hypothetical protein